MSITKKEDLISLIIDKEWTLFDKVEGIDGRASCQDDKPTFYIMRGAQFAAWDTPTLESYYIDLCQAEMAGRNLLSEKYAYMMEFTMPEAYEKLKHLLPVPDAEKQALLADILAVLMRQTEAFMREYPKFLRISRPVYTEQDGLDTSIETYELGEMKTYSTVTLSLYYKHICEMEAQGQRIVYQIMENTAKAYGYESLEHVERTLA